MDNRCQTHDMKKSKGIINGVTGRRNSVGNLLRGVTMNINPLEWRLVDVMKCRLCGYSEAL